MEALVSHDTLRTAIYGARLRQVIRGCVSGAQIDTLREICDQGDGEFEFEGIDGFDEME